MFDLEKQMNLWKSHMLTARSISVDDVEELESHLRDSIDELCLKQLSVEEAFLVAVSRLGDVDGINEEFSKIDTEDVWRQLFIPISYEKNRKELILVLLLALLGGLLSKIPALFGYGDIDAHGIILVKNASLFVLFPIALYFMYKRSLSLLRSLVVLTFFPFAALIVNTYPSYEPHHTAILSAIHLPIITLFFVLYFFGGPSLGSAKGWRSTHTRLNFIRFAGELFVFSVLIGLGGIVLILLTMGTFELIGRDVSSFVQSWMAPLGFFGLFTVGAYLVEQKKSLIESMAPVLARIFTPLFLLVMVALIIAFIITPHAAYENRALLIWFDLILALVLALTLYSMSAKESTKTSSPTIWDIFSLLLLLSAIVVDGIALGGIIIRLSTSGFSPNKSAALGENIILLINLILLAYTYLRFVIRKKPFEHIVELQMRFLPVYAIWASFVVVVFPLIFHFR